MEKSINCIKENWESDLNIEVKINEIVIIFISSTTYKRDNPKQFFDVKRNYVDGRKMEIVPTNNKSESVELAKFVADGYEESYIFTCDEAIETFLDIQKEVGLKR